MEMIKKKNYLPYFQKFYSKSRLQRGILQFELLFEQLFRIRYIFVDMVKIIFPFYSVEVPGWYRASRKLLKMSSNCTAPSKITTKKKRLKWSNNDTVTATVLEQI